MRNLMNMPPIGLARAFLLLALGGNPALALDLRVVGPDGVGVGGIAIYVEPVDKTTAWEASVDHIEVRQRDRVFQPHFSVAQAGASVVFINDDDITHHVYSVVGPYQFSHSLRVGQQTQALKLIEPGLIAMGCNIHDWMNGYLKVVSTPWFALTNASGRAGIPVSTSARVLVQAWHPQIDNAPAVVVEGSTGAEVILRLARSLPRVLPQQRTDNFDFLDGY